MYSIHFTTNKIIIFRSKFSRSVVQNIGSFYNYKNYKVLSFDFRTTAKFLIQGSHVVITPKVKNYLQLWR
jgi:hypothetical protein